MAFIAWTFLKPDASFYVSPESQILVGTVLSEEVVKTGS